jgi:hypothetical protein
VRKDLAMSKLMKFAVVMLVIAGATIIGTSIAAGAECENAKPHAWIVGTALALGVLGLIALTIEGHRQDKEEEAKRKAEGRPPGSIHW